MESETERLIPHIPREGENLINYGTSSSQQVEGDTMGIKLLNMKSSNGEGQKLTQYVAALSATLGALAAGAVLGFTSPTDKELKDGDLGFKISETEFNWVASLAPLGCLVMCVPVGAILDFLGRKMTMLAVIGVFTVGWGLIVGASSVGMLMAGRFLTGMAGGTFCVAAPLYTSEIAQKEIRGALGSYFQLMITVGILFVYVVGKFVRPFYTAIACGILPFVFGLAFVFMPESPMYLLKKGNKDKALSNLQWLRGAGYDTGKEIKELEDEINEDASNPVSFKDSWAKKATKKAFFICFALMFFQQLSGVNAVIFFTSGIFKSAGSSLEPKDASIIVGVMQVLATLVSTLAIDRLGRKLLLLISIGIMSICTLLLGVFFTLQRSWSDKDIQNIGWLPILALCVFIIVFSLGFGPIPWMITAEVFPREVKSIASSAAGTFNWFLAFLVTTFFNQITAGIGNDATFYIFTGICVLGFLFVMFVVLETKGKSLSEIQRELGGESPRVSSSNGIVNEGFNSA